MDSTPLFTHGGRSGAFRTHVLHASHSRCRHERQAHAGISIATWHLPRNAWCTAGERCALSTSTLHLPCPLWCCAV